MKKSNKDSTKKLYRFYYILASVDLFMLMFTLFLGHKNLLIFKDSLVNNQKFVEHLQLAEDLSFAASAVNAPGNNVFDSLDVNKERQLFLKYEADFLGKLESVKELSKKDSLDTLEKSTKSIEQSFAEMKSEAFKIFKAISENNLKYAGTRMATMDQKYADLNEGLSRLRSDLSRHQTTTLSAQSEHIETLGLLEKVVGVFVLVMVFGIAFYGHKMSRAWEHQNKLVSDRETQLVDSQKMASLGEMASAIVHEIQNPLAVISGKAAILEKKMAALGAENAQSVASDTEMIKKMVARIGGIIQSVRGMSHGNGGEAKFEKIEFRVFLNEVLALASARAKSASAFLKVSHFEDFSLECQPVPLSQVVLNLINNAADAVSEYQDKWIQLDVLKFPEYVQISVTDSGKGLPPEVAEKIMSPFFTTKERGKGTGLGLSICKRIAESHGGSFRYNPDSPNTQFVVRIPIAQSQAAPTQKAA